MHLKSKIRRGELTIGTWITIPHPSVIEVLSTAGFEWVTIDMEHAAINISQAQTLIMAAQGKKMKAFVRVSANEPTPIKHALDAGADGVIVPMINTRADALKMVDHIYYPPIGKRGTGLARAQNYGIGFEEYRRRLEKDIIVVAQIEHIQAIENIKSILSVEAIDATIIGPYDLSASMGKPGQYHLPEVKKTIEAYDTACIAMNKPRGAHVISSDIRELNERIARGYSFLAFSLDFFFLGDKAREEMKKLRQ